MSAAYPWRCFECGKKLGRDFLRFDEPEKCREHRRSPALTWTNTRRYAMNYIEQAAHRGDDLDAFVIAPPSGSADHVSRSDLAEALVLARRWRLPTFVEEQLASLDDSPRGLYG